MRLFLFSQPCTVHCLSWIIKRSRGKKNYIYIYRNLERERREAREMDGYMGEFFFILTCVIRSWSLYYFVLAFTASVVLLKVCHKKKKPALKGKRSTVIILVLEDLVVALCCPPSYFYSHFLQVEINTRNASYTSSLDLEQGVVRVSPRAC